MSSRDSGHHLAAEVGGSIDPSKLENTMVLRDGRTVDHPGDECPLDCGAAGGSLKLCRYQGLVARTPRDPAR